MWAKPDKEDLWAWMKELDKPALEPEIKRVEPNVQIVPVGQSVEIVPVKLKQEASFYDRLADQEKRAKDRLEFLGFLDKLQAKYNRWLQTQKTGRLIEVGDE